MIFSFVQKCRKYGQMGTMADGYSHGVIPILKKVMNSFNQVLHAAQPRGAGGIRYANQKLEIWGAVYVDTLYNPQFQIFQRKKKCGNWKVSKEEAALLVSLLWGIITKIKIKN